METILGHLAATTVGYYTIKLCFHLNS